MRITAWRIVKAKHKKRAFDGEGARIAGGRWNKIGTPMIYTADSLALAALEIIVHLPDKGLFNKIFLRIPVRFDAGMVISLESSRIPRDWNSFPVPESTQDIGTQWALDKKSAVLKVPSTIIREEYNYLINPEHPDFKKISIGAPARFVFDPRVKISRS
jgi:RES domain-containing protein